MLGSMAARGQRRITAIWRAAATNAAGIAPHQTAPPLAAIKAAAAAALAAVAAWHAQLATSLHLRLLAPLRHHSLQRGSIIAQRALARNGGVK
jgi:hypothetical protein